MNNFWTEVRREIIIQQKACILIVAAVKGSCPGKPGFKMAIFPDGELVGSIGGGKLEFDLAEEAKSSLKMDGNSGIFNLIIKDHQTEGPRASGMSCAGTQSNLQLFLNIKHLPLLDRFIQCEEGLLSGSISIVDNSIYFSETIQTNKFELKIDPSNQWHYKENIGQQDTVYIVGAGHVGLALSEVMKFLDFQVILFDHRTDINTLSKNLFHDKLITGSYEEIANHIRDVNTSYVVIVSHSHESDQVVLDALLEKGIKYLGMMGSKAKIKKILQNIDYDKRRANKNLHIYSPIGLKINSISTKEIAISIAAEIISVKNKNYS